MLYFIAALLSVSMAQPTDCKNMVNGLLAQLKVERIGGPKRTEFSAMMQEQASRQLRLKGLPDNSPERPTLSKTVFNFGYDRNEEFDDGFSSKGLSRADYTAFDTYDARPEG